MTGLPVPMNLHFHPLTPDRWSDLETLFGPRGACGGCWCMWWRMPKSQYEQQKGEGNRAALKEIVDSGTIPGIIAYVKDEPVGWCAVQPREAYPRMERSRVMKRIDDEPVWSVSCLFVARDSRRCGVSTRLLSAAVDHARRNGARIVEGYAVEPKKPDMPDVFAANGLAAAYSAAGFVEVARGSETRPIMRHHISVDGRP